MTRGVIGFVLLFVVGLAIAYGFKLVGVPVWLSTVVTFAIGYTSAPHIHAMFDDRGSNE